MLARAVAVANRPPILLSLSIIGTIQLKRGIDNRLYITVPEAVETLGISRNFGYELIKQGKLPVIRLGEKRLVITRAALEKMLEKGVTQCLG